MKIILREEKRLLSEKELAIVTYNNILCTFYFLPMVLIIKISYTDDRKVKVEEIAI